MVPRRPLRRRRPAKNSKDAPAGASTPVMEKTAGKKSKDAPVGASTPSTGAPRRKSFLWCKFREEVRTRQFLEKMPGKVDPRVAPAVAAASYATQMAGHDEPRPRWAIIALLTYLNGVQPAAADRELVQLPGAATPSVATWLVAMLFVAGILFGVIFTRCCRARPAGGIHPTGPITAPLIPTAVPQQALRQPPAEPEAAPVPPAVQPPLRAGGRGQRRDILRRRTVSTQSQTNYSWWRSSPRFNPLPERSHGAWADTARARRAKTYRLRAWWARTPL